MGLYRILSEVNGDFTRKRKKISHPRVFCAPAEGVPLELGTGVRVKTRMLGLPDRERISTISSAMWLQSTNVTGRRTDTGDRKDRASHSVARQNAKNVAYLLCESDQRFRVSCYFPIVKHLWSLLSVMSNYGVVDEFGSKLWINRDGLGPS